MIRFECKNCGRTIKVADEHAGKKGKCPDCKNIVVVPPRSADKPVSQMQFEPPLPAAVKEDPQDHQSQYYDGLSPSQAANLDNKPPERTLPWPIDIFLYPMSVSGIITIVTIIALKFLNSIVGFMAQIFMGVLLVWIILILLITGYTFWYFCECVRDSARGNIRACLNWTESVDFWTLIGSAFRPISLVLLFWSPAVAYRVFLHVNEKSLDMWFWLIIAMPVVFFPMALLAIAMFDSKTGFNPFIWISSIFSTFIPYLGLVLFFVVIIALILSAHILLVLPYLSYPVRFITLWLTLVWAHLLGCFYKRYQDKLYWVG